MPGRRNPRRGSESLHSGGGGAVGFRNGALAPLEQYFKPVRVHTRWSHDVCFPRLAGQGQIVDVLPRVQEGGHKPAAFQRMFDWTGSAVPKLGWRTLDLGGNGESAGGQRERGGTRSLLCIWWRRDDSNIVIWLATLDYKYNLWCKPFLGTAEGVDAGDHD